MPAPAPIVAEIPVRPLANPDSSPISLRIAVVTTAGRARRLTSVGLFPVDQPQSLAVRLPRTARQLTITLVYGPAPLTVEVGPIRWRQAEPRPAARP